MSIDVRLINGSSMIVAGPTQAGKTTFVNGLLNVRHWIFKTQPISQIYWFCNEIPKANKRADCEYSEGIPENGFNSVKWNSIVVLDDLMDEAKGNCHVTNLFTKISHHRNCFVIYITQNYFAQSGDEITRRRNSQYVVLFKNPADASQIRTVANKMFPESPYFLTKTYKNAVSRAHGYLLLDLRQETADDLRVRSNILPNEFPIIVYKQIGTRRRNAK